MPFSAANPKHRSGECNYPHWSLVIHADESSPEFNSAVEHVENCQVCQMRIESSASHGLTWWPEAKQSWLEDDLPEKDSKLGTGSIIIEIQPEMPDDSRIEFETVGLPFLAPPSHPELMGRLGRYEIERVIGTGGMGIVLKAHDTELHRPVAIKILASHLANSASARRRFAREAQAAAAVLHPNVIPIYNVESEGSTPYLVMQYVNGSSLQSRIDRDGPLPISEVLRIAMQTAAGLSAAHEQGLVHRDVKPANILLHDNVDRVVLSDFGLARAVDDASLTRTGIVAGTPHYMSPEQARGDAIDTRSDQFSLGCVMYFALAGRPPFRASNAMGVLHRICNDAHRPMEQVNEDVPIEVARLIDRLMAKSPSDRFPSMHAIHDNISKLLESLQSGRLSISKQSADTSIVTRKWTSILWTASVASLLITASLISWTSREPERQRTSLRIDERTHIHRQLENYSKEAIDLEILSNSIEHQMNAMERGDATFLSTNDANFMLEVQSIEMQIHELNLILNPIRNEEKP